MNANRGYSGWSMSVRAVQAYENSEMPKSKWTKTAMLNVIYEWLGDNGIQITSKQAVNLSSLPKAVLFDTLFTPSSWHHTSKRFNKTDFYSLDADALRELVNAHAVFEPDWVLFVRGNRGLLHFTTRRDRDDWYTMHDYQSDDCQKDGFARKFVGIR